MGIVGDRIGMVDLNVNEFDGLMFFCHSLPPEKFDLLGFLFSIFDQQTRDFGRGKLVHFPVLLPLSVGLPPLGLAGGGGLWEMPAGVLQETPQNIGDLFFMILLATWLRINH